jgi:hypothetical protein
MAAPDKWFAGYKMRADRRLEEFKRNSLRPSAQFQSGDEDMELNEHLDKSKHDETGGDVDMANKRPPVPAASVLSGQHAAPVLSATPPLPTPKPEQKQQVAQALGAAAAAAPNAPSSGNHGMPLLEENRMATRNAAHVLSEKLRLYTERAAANRVLDKEKRTAKAAERARMSPEEAKQANLLCKAMGDMRIATVATNTEYNLSNGHATAEKINMRIPFTYSDIARGNTDEVRCLDFYAVHSARNGNAFCVAVLDVDARVMRQFTFKTAGTTDSKFTTMTRHWTGRTVALIPSSKSDNAHVFLECNAYLMDLLVPSKCKDMRASFMDAINRASATAAYVHAISQNVASVASSVHARPSANIFDGSSGASGSATGDGRRY